MRWDINDDSLNAFATWWWVKNSHIVFSRWLLSKLKKDEIEAVAAHELTHIINWDVKIMYLSTIFIWIIFLIWELLLRTMPMNKSIIFVMSSFLSFMIDCFTFSKFGYF